MHSALYTGTLTHRRHAPRPHAFGYRLYMAYLDLAELDAVFAGRWLWSTRRPAWMRWRRSDHLGDPAQPLDDAVRELVAQRTGRRPTGAVRLLTNLRCAGWGFNPVSYFYCFEPLPSGGERLQAVVAEVSNTPWGERHCYVMDTPWQQHGEAHRRYRVDKDFHVSPFMPMGLHYDWGFSTPGERLGVHMRLQPRGDTGAQAALPLFDAALSLRRREIGAASLAAALLRHPAMALRVSAGIYAQALRLWLKRTPLHSHPASAALPHTRR